MSIDGPFHTKKCTSFTIGQGYNIIGMLVREQTKEIEISMDNKIVSIKRDTKEYTYKRKIYNFNEIEDDECQQNKNGMLKAQNNKVQALENYPTQPDMPSERNKQVSKDSKSRFNYEKDPQKIKSRQIRQNNTQKVESYALLKFLGSILVILIIMTIFQSFYPQSQFNILRIFHSPIKTSLLNPSNSGKNDL